MLRSLTWTVLDLTPTVQRVLMEVESPAEAAETAEGLRPHDARYISVRAHVEL